MNLKIIVILLCGITLSVHAQDQSSSTYIIKADMGTDIIGPESSFSGEVHVRPLFQADNDISVSAAYVTFSPGSRTAWHTHPAGQRLVVTSGTGFTQIEGQPIQIIHTGDVVICPPGIKHWHGAAPNTHMTHLAITTPINGKSVEWMEKVTDEQYYPH